MALYHYFDVLTNTRGDSLPGYQVLVYFIGGARAQIYADANSTPIVSVSNVANVALTDSEGNFSLYVVPANYDLEFRTPTGDFLKRVKNVPLLSGPSGQNGQDAVPRTYRETLVTGQTIIPNPALYADFSEVPVETASATKTGLSFTEGGALFIDGNKKSNTIFYTVGSGFLTLATPAAGGEVAEVTTLAIDGSSMINTSKGSVDPRDFGAVGDASVETGLGTDDTDAVQAAFDYALANGLVVDAPEKHKFAIKEVWGNVGIGRLNLGRASALGEKHGLWLPGKAGRNYDPLTYSATPGALPFDDNPENLTLEHVMIDAADGLSSGLTILGGVNVHAGCVGRQFTNGASNALTFGTTYANGRNTSACTYDAKVDADAGGVFSPANAGASSCVQIYGVTPTAFGTMGIVAYHRANGGTYPDNPFWAEEINGTVDLVGGYYGLNYAGAVRNSVGKGRSRQQIRIVNSQNNNHSLDVDMEADDWWSVIMLMNFFNRNHRVTFRTKGSQYVAGAALIDIGFSAADIQVDESLLGTLVSPNGAAKAAIRAHDNIERLRITNTEIFGEYQTAAILMQSGSSSADPVANGIPVNSGTGEAYEGETPGVNGAYDNQSRIPSSLEEVSGCRFNLTTDTNAPLIAAYQLGTLAPGVPTQPLSIGKITGNMLGNGNWPTIITGFRDDGPPIVIEEMTGNSWAAGIKERNFDLSAFNVLKRELNTGDPGAGAKEVVSKGSAPFPAAGYEVFMVDITNGPAVVVGNNYDYLLAGVPVTTRSTFTSSSGSEINVTRVENLVNKTGGTPGVYDAGIGAGNLILAADDPWAAVTYRAGSDSAIGFQPTSGGEDPRLMAQSVAVQITDGKLVQRGPIPSGILDMSVSPGQKVAMAYDRARNTVIATVDDIDSSELPATLSNGSSTRASFPIATLGTDVSYTPGVRPAPPAGKPVNTVLPTVSFAGGNVTANLGTWTNAKTLELQYTEDGDDVGLPQIIRNGRGGADIAIAPYPTVTGRFYGVRVKETNPIGGRIAKTRVTIVTVVAP